MQTSIILTTIVIALATISHGAPAPGLGHSFIYAALPSSDTKVVRDALGNQATSYAYQDGHSSAVALSRNDVSKHLVHVPAPVVYAAPAPVVHHEVHAAPVPAYHGAYHHTYAAAAPAAYAVDDYPYTHGYAAAPAYYY